MFNGHFKDNSLIFLKGFDLERYISKNPLSLIELFETISNRLVFSFNLLDHTFLILSNPILPTTKSGKVAVNVFSICTLKVLITILKSKWF